MNPIVYNLVERAYPYRLRGTDNQQTDTGLLWTPPSYRATQTGGSPVAFSTLPSQGLALGYVRWQNRSGSTGALGIGVRIPNRYWIAGQWDDDAGTPYTDDTDDAQDTGTGDFALESTTDSDGFVVACQVPFNAISLDVGTASVGGAAVRAARYSNSDGSGWTNFANPFIQDGASGDYSTGEQLLVWQAPTDWGQVQVGGLSGVRGGFYAVNVRATTAPTGTAALADSLSVYRLYLLREGVTDNSVVEWNGSPAELRMEPLGDALVALFETANNQNLVTALVRTW